MDGYADDKSKLCSKLIQVRIIVLLMQKNRSDSSPLSLLLNEMFIKRVERYIFTF